MISKYSKASGLLITVEETARYFEKSVKVELCIFKD